MMSLEAYFSLTKAPTPFIFFFHLRHYDIHLSPNNPFDLTPSINIFFQIRLNFFIGISNSMDKCDHQAASGLLFFSSNKGKPVKNC